jgi:hypothetical protein
MVAGVVISLEGVFVRLSYLAASCLSGEWHFRFAKRSVAEGDDDEDNEGEADTVLEDEGLQPWLFPEWKVYILPLDTSDGPKLSRKLGST